MTSRGKDYFSQINRAKKPKSTAIFSSNGCDEEKLIKIVNDLNHINIDTLETFENLYNEMFNLMTVGKNILLSSPGSCYEPLEKFLVRISSLTARSIFRFNGYASINYETFKSKVLNPNHDSFSQKVKNGFTCCFVIHNFDMLYRESRRVCDGIFDLYLRYPKEINVILSVKHVNSILILKPILHNIAFYGDQPLSRFTSLANQDVFKRMKRRRKIKKGDVWHDDINYKILSDIYQALQAPCQQVLIFILKYFLENVDKKELRLLDLSEFTQTNLICQRTSQLKTYLSELKDHKLIESDTDFRTIRSVISESTSRTFLENKDRED